MAIRTRRHRTIVQGVPLRAANEYPHNSATHPFKPPGGYRVIDDPFPPGRARLIAGSAVCPRRPSGALEPPFPCSSRCDSLRGLWDPFLRLDDEGTFDTCECTRAAIETFQAYPGLSCPAIRFGRLQTCVSNSSRSAHLLKPVSGPQTFAPPPGHVLQDSLRHTRPKGLKQYPQQPANGADCRDQDNTTHTHITTAAVLAARQRLLFAPRVAAPERNVLCISVRARKMTRRLREAFLVVDDDPNVPPHRPARPRGGGCVVREAKNGPTPWPFSEMRSRTLSSLTCGCRCSTAGVSPASTAPAPAPTLPSSS